MADYREPKQTIKAIEFKRSNAVELVRGEGRSVVFVFLGAFFFRHLRKRKRVCALASRFLERVQLNLIENKNN